MNRTEKGMREEKVPTFDTQEELKKYIQDLCEGEHDYGTCVYAMSMAATASFNYVTRFLGVTGFKASMADLDILKRTRNLEDGFMVLDYNKLLYLQNLTSDNFPAAQKLIEDNKKHIAKRARKKLKEVKGAHPDVVAHWEKLSALHSGDE